MNISYSEAEFTDQLYLSTFEYIEFLHYIYKIFNAPFQNIGERYFQI